MKPATPGDSANSLFYELVDEAAERIQAGKAADLESYARQHPQYADRLRRIWPSIEMLAALGHSRDGSASLAPLAVDAAGLENGVLGDFRIVREIGRGGMGVVYEAEQISLARRVALKVLPFAAMLDERQLQRFKNEARAAASLHHTNIVPVYSVGCERGVHYYAMQYIEGQTLAEVIRQLRREVEPLAPDDLQGTELREDPTSNATDTIPVAALSTAVSGCGREHFRTVAELGVQTAEALEYAHSLGVVHRDIKPSNLILDAAGRLWIADFGLARVESEANLTLTGELLGTLRYMSPEQIETEWAVLDHRADVYALAATLYELLTLEPVFGQTRRPALVRQIVQDEPQPPRRLNAAIPRELETIVLKALAKNPVDRYATAGAMAEDLRRFLDGRTVLARRPTWLDSTVKWSRRHLVIVAAVFVTLLLTTVVSCVAAIVVWREGLETVAALDAAKIKTREAEFQSARLALERAMTMCDDGDIGRGLNWLAYALQLCPEDEADYQRVIRANLEAWSGQIHPVEMVLDHPDRVATVAFTGDGKRLLTSCDDGRVRVWNAVSGDLLITLAVEDPPVGPLAVAVHPKDNFMAVGDWSGRLHVLEIATGRSVFPPRQHSEAKGNSKRLTYLAFSPDGESIVACSADSQVRFWPVQAGPARGTSMLHPLPVHALGFAPDGQTAMTGTNDGTVHAWKVPTGESLGTLFELAHDIPYGLAWQDEGRQLIVAGENFGASAWDRETGAISARHFPHMARVSAVAASEERSLTVTGSDDLSAQVWQGPSAKPWGARMDHGAYVSCVAFDASGERFATGAGSQVRMCRIAAPELPAPALAGLGQSSPSLILQMSPDGREVYAIGDDGRIRSWWTATGEPTGLAEGNAEFFAVSRDGTQLIWISPSEAGGYRLDTRQRLWQIPCTYHDGIFFSPSGARLLAILGPTATVIDFSTGKVIRRFAENSIGGKIAAFSPDESLVAVKSTESMVRIWDVQTGKAVGVPLHQTGQVCDVQFSSDGATLRVGTGDGKIWFWDVAKRQQTRARTQLPPSIRAMNFHPYGQMALGVAGDGSAQFFDIATGSRIGPPLLHFGKVEYVAYTADGGTIATRGPDNGARYWRVPRPAPGSATEIQRRIEILTCQALDKHETIIHLTATEWRERREQMKH